MNFDSVIVGSGVGSLTTAAALAICGKHVLVLEQHNRPGGYLHSFQRKNWEWNIGLHFIPAFRAEDELNKMFHTLTGNRVQLSPFKDKTLILEYPGRKFEFNSDSDYLKKKISEAFPAEKESLDAFWNKLERVGASAQKILMPGFLPKRAAATAFFFSTLPFFFFRNKTVKQVIDESFLDPKLKEFFYYFTTENGMAPDRSSFLFYAMMKASFFNGYSYPRGGGEAIVDALIKTIEANGGKIRTGFEVENVVVKEGKAVGVNGKNGEYISGKNVVSGIGLQETFDRLLEPHHINNSYRKNINRFGTSGSMLTLFVGLKGDIAGVGAESGNFRIFWDAPLSNGSDPTAIDWKPDGAMIMFPSLVDSAPNNDMHHTCEVMIQTRYEYFRKWENQKSRKKDASYREMKARLEQRLLKILIERFPGIEKFIRFYELGTPVTYEHYCRRRNGAFLGMEVTPEKFNNQQIHSVSPIKNLFLTGGDVTTCGVVGSFMSGIIAASHVTGKRLPNLLKQIDKPNQC